jgi:hypothetical protein
VPAPSCQRLKAAIAYYHSLYRCGLRFLKVYYLFTPNAAKAGYTDS